MVEGGVLVRIGQRKEAKGDGESVGVADKLGNCELVSANRKKKENNRKRM